jgi:hypothetical protein
MFGVPKVEAAPAPASAPVAFVPRPHEVKPQGWDGMLKPAILRAEADMGSQRIGEVIPGNIVEVLEQLTLSDGTVRARTPAGWLTKSKAAVQTAPILRPLTAEEAEQAGDGAESKHVVVSKRPAILREEKELDSEQKGEASVGSTVEVFETVSMQDGSVRARTENGWLTMSKSRERADGGEFLKELTDEELYERGGLTDLRILGKKGSG